MTNFDSKLNTVGSALAAAKQVTGFKRPIELTEREWVEKIYKSLCDLVAAMEDANAAQGLKS